MSENVEDVIEEIMQVNRNLSKALQAGLVPVLLELELSMAQLKTLYTLARETPMTVGQVGERLGIGIPAASHQVDKLVQAGLVQRTEDSVDRRRTMVQLTSSGEHLVQQLTQGREEQFRGWLKQLSLADLEHLLAGIKALSQVV